METQEQRIKELRARLDQLLREIRATPASPAQQELRAQFRALQRELVAMPYEVRLRARR